MNFLGRNKNDQQPAPFDVSKMEHELLPPISYNDKFDQLAHEGAERMTAATYEENIGRITAEAMATQHETIADELTELAKEMVSLVKQIDKLKIEADENANYLLDTAMLFREAGRKSAQQVEETTQMINEFRSTCEQMRKRIAP